MKIMPPDSSNDDEEPFVELDPSGRFGRYDERLGAGAMKKVYRGFDKREGMDVAWNKVGLKNFANDPSVAKRLRLEISILKSLNSQNVIGLYGFWYDGESDTLNFITELCASGSLRSYRKKHRHVSVRALKKWSRQILTGLNYLHTHDPCIIHRDINCGNVFINGNDGQIKIGDLGLVAVVGKSHAAHSLLGTPEYMAPELYEEDYNESVDIYSFGLCLLEMATGEIPYAAECQNVAQIYRKVTMGMKPMAINRVGDPELKAFIEKCIGQPRKRPSASDLLHDQFFSELESDEN
ncbi:putative serine/threonine-protein kinase wnk11 [Sarracenia purpurea var. burkii]